MPATRPPSLSRSQLPDVVTPAELADYLRVDVRTIRMALATGEVPGATRIGRSWRIDMPAYDAAKVRTVS